MKPFRCRRLSLSEVSLLACWAMMTLIPNPSAVIAWTTTDAAGGGIRTRSLFTGQSIAGTPTRHYRQWSMYTNDQAPPAGPDHNAWTVLSHTEEWISKTLNSANSNNAGGSGGGNNGNHGKNLNNPYARKEVSYVCENQTSSAMIVSNLFKWLRDARKQGESHGEAEQERRTTLGERYEPSTFRQTQVVVIPSNPVFDSFFVFDDLVNAINQARRDARDLVTYNYDEDDEDDTNAWNVAINCAHMHPKYGERTIKQKIEELKALDAAGGEVDVNLEAYKAMRLAARRSPYPSIVIEVRATPTPDFGTAAQQSPPPAAAAAAANKGAVGGGQVSWEDIQKLEALFGKSAAVDKGQRSGEAAFWDQIGSQIQEVSSVTPTLLAQEWISRNLKDVEKATACITESSTSHVDSAYQFVFANIAMMEEEHRKQTTVPHFLVLSNFLSTSATSFEKFTFSISEILNTIPELRQRLELSTYHPEHVDPSRRSPTPILSLSWRK